MDELAALVEQVPDEVLEYIEELETRVEKAEAALPEPPVTDDVDPIAKALSELPEEIAKAFEDQKTRLAKAEEALEQERIAKADAEWTEKARSIDGLIDDPATFGSDLRQVAETHPELADSIMSKLQAAGKRFAKSSLFNESGHTAPIAGSAEEKVEQIAKSLVEADPAITKAEAEAQVWEKHPELYDQYVNERRDALKS